MMRVLANIFRLGIKELRSLRRDSIMVVLIIFAFSINIYLASSSKPETLHKAPIAIIDEDQSPLSTRIVGAFYPPHFMPPSMTDLAEADAGMDAGLYTFALNIPPDFQSDVLAGHRPAIQLNIDATRMGQAFTGGGYVQQIIQGEVGEFLAGTRGSGPQPVELAIRARFNPTLTESWSLAIMEIIDNITMLSIVLTGAALIREREHGTIEHLLVMPVTPFEIMMSKVWAMGAVVLLACAFSLIVIAHGLLQVPIQGSVPLFLMGAGLHLFATTSLGIFMATVARSMPQFGLLLILIMLPLQLLSGGMTPREAMPDFVQDIMLVAPTTHFVKMAQAILFRGAGLDVVWPQFAMLAILGALFFIISLARFRKTISTMG